MRFRSGHMMTDGDENVQTVVLLPAGVRRVCEQRAAAERRSLSGFLRNVISDNVGDGSGPAASSAAGVR
jgi:hypothetical protein